MGETTYALACNEVMMRAVGLRTEATGDFVYIDARTGPIRYEVPRRDYDYLECGNGPESRFARGDSRSLPTRPAAHEPASFDPKSRFPIEKSRV